MDISYPLATDTPVSDKPFSPCVRVGNFVFVSGQASVDLSGKIIRGSFAEEFQRSMENFTRVLGTAGAGPQHVVQTRCYVDDPANMIEFNRLYAAIFSKPYPARTTITSCFGGSLHFEIDGIAVVP